MRLISRDCKRPLLPVSQLHTHTLPHLADCDIASHGAVKATATVEVAKAKGKATESNGDGDSRKKHVRNLFWENGTENTARRVSSRQLSTEETRLAV